jgi:SSS family solute:Na+ symporter
LAEAGEPDHDHRVLSVTAHIVVLSCYSLALMALGLWIGRHVGGASDFFVAGRRLGPGLIFSTMLAANIGAGSTVGAASRGYAGGIAAWWWVGSAGLGSLILALSIGPSMRRVAAAYGLRTVGDFLEHRYSRNVRAIVAALLWVGSLFILSSQLTAIGWILNVVAGIPRPAGCIIGGTAISVYFAAGGLLTAAWVNAVQLTVKLAGFGIALPLAIAGAGGWRTITTVGAADPSYWTFWRTGPPGAVYLALLVPAFIVSPGLLQKIFGARDDRAVRLGVGLNAVGLLLFAAVPAVLGIIARGRFPELADSNLALPSVLIHGVPPLAGALGLAAVFSAEISAADAVLFMLTTSLSQDLYKRFVNPAADDRRVLQVARWTTVVGGALGVGLAIALADVIESLTIFYTLLGVSLFVPIVAGLYVARTTSAGALASIVAGVGGMLVVHIMTGGLGWGVMTPALAGLLAAIAAWVISLMRRIDLDVRQQSVSP